MRQATLKRRIFRRKKCKCLVRTQKERKRNRKKKLIQTIWFSIMMFLWLFNDLRHIRLYSDLCYHVSRYPRNHFAQIYIKCLFTQYTNVNMFFFFFFEWKSSDGQKSVELLTWKELDTNVENTSFEEYLYFSKKEIFYLYHRKMQKKNISLCW